MVLEGAKRSGVNDAYNGAKITLGTETRTITDYVGGTGTVTMNLGFSSGANILAARALMPIISLSQQVDGWVRAGQARRSLADFVQIPKERKSGTAINKYSGNILHPHPTPSPLYLCLCFSIGSDKKYAGSDFVWICLRFV